MANMFFHYELVFKSMYWSPAHTAKGIVVPVYVIVTIKVIVSRA